MVLAVKVGRARKPAVGFGLALATFNVYSYFWDYKAHREVFDQFELGRDGRSDGGFWYFLSTALPVLRFPYYYAAVANVQHVRLRLGLRQGIGPGVFLAFTIPAVTALLIGYFAGSYLVFAGDAERDVTLIAWGIAAILAGLALYTLLETIAYVRLQRDINGVWGAYDARAEQLRAARRPAPGEGWIPVPGPTAAGPAPRPRPTPAPVPPPARPPNPQARASDGAASAAAPKPRPRAATSAPKRAPPAGPRRPPR